MEFLRNSESEKNETETESVLCSVVFIQQSKAQRCKLVLLFGLRSAYQVSQIKQTLP